MKHKQWSYLGALAVFVSQSFLLTANAADYTGGQLSNTNITAAGVVVPDGARLLASQCFQCHGTNGKSTTGIDSLAGESQNEIISEMREMKAKTKVDLMHYQAKAYTDAQIQLIAAYFASVSRGNSSNNNHDD
ncbi:c-type cytochrome [uncultured Thiothrix sp.]|uniref:c-type cytochrome n=1 Tax=uncultured Thiothrix sp. TaxID=223185 RepID=UPI0026127628|nr:c-type cytochrome [uncultured Thiothrix sp.]HMT91965.1 cytochrome c class I [Thiolinea sp.]